MSTRSLVVMLTLAACAVAAWLFLDDRAGHQAARFVRQATHGLQPAAPAAGLRKCVDGARVVYTDSACPAGSREQALTGGALTVLPPPPQPRGTAQAPAPAASARPLLRELVHPAGEVSLQDRMVDQVR